MDGGTDSDLTERLQEARRRIFEHPAYVEAARCDAFRQALMGVFVPNLVELVVLLERPEVDEDLAIELMQNVHRPDVREAFTGKVVQGLHNYLASTMTLVDHSRRLMRKRAGPVVDEFERRKTELLQHLELRFVQDLRDFTLHRSLPEIHFTVTLPDAGATDQRARGVVNLAPEDLMTWREWHPDSQRFLSSLGDDPFALSPVIRKQGALVFGLNAWLLDELVRANEAGLQDVDRLVVEANAVLTGGDVEEAERITRNLTKLRNQPASGMTTDEYIDAVFRRQAPSDASSSTGSDS